LQSVTRLAGGGVFNTFSEKVFDLK
jgi:hypothetical protein